MAKDVGLKIKLTTEGEDVVISNLQQLEGELEKLEAQLKTQDFGSEAFNNTARNIATLRGQIENIDKQVEGLSVERQFQAIGSAVNVAVGSFQALSGVVGLFISDTEDLEELQRLEAQALQVLNVAIGINTTLTELNEAAKLKDIIATKAQAAASRVAAIATAAWNAVLALNPVVAIAAGVVALTAAVYGLVRAFSSSNKEQEEANKQAKIYNDLQRELQQNAKKTAQDLKVNLSLLTDNVSQRNLEIRALKDLKKEFPGLNAFIDKNNQLTEEGIELIKTQIRIREIEANLQILRQRKIDLEIKSQTDLNEAIEDGSTFFGALKNNISGFFKGRVGTFENYIGSIADAIEDEGRELKVVNGLIETQTEELDDLLGEYSKFQVKLDAAAKAEEELAKNAGKTNEAFNKSLINIAKRTQAYNDLAEAVSKLSEVELNYTAEILEKQEEALGEQEAFLTERAEFFKTSGERLVEEINNFLFKTIPSAEQAKELVDGYGELFEIIDKAFKSGELDFGENFGFGEFVEFAEGLSEDIGKKLVNVSDESKAAFIDYFATLQDRVIATEKLINEADGFDGFTTIDTEDVRQLRQVEELYSELLRSRVENGNTLQDVENQTIFFIKQSLKLGKEELTIAERQRLINEQILEQAKIAEAGNEEEKQQAIEKIKALEEQKKALDEVVNSILNGVKNTDNFVVGLREVQKQAAANAEVIEKNREEIEKAFDPNNLDALREFFKANAEEFPSIFEDLSANSAQYLDKLGKDGILAILGGVSDGLSEVEGKSRQELEKLQSYLVIVGNEFADQFGLEDNPFLKLIEKIKMELKTLPTQAEENFSKVVEDIQAIADVVLEVFSNITGRLQGILQAQTAMMLENLEYSQEATLATIGEANTENAKENEKIAEERAKVERQFAKQRFEIEKQARVQELGFTLASAIADGANAVVQALALPAPPPIPQIYAGVIGGLVAAEVAMISSQINSAQSKVFIGRRGGLINGSDHESGGVPALLEGGEFVMSRPAVDKYGDIVGQLNSSVGGRSLSIDDSRIVQAISSQNTSKTPIKTYVLYNDIQDTDKLNKKIENLSKL